MERTSLYEDDLTEERNPTPVQREENAHSIALDPDVVDTADPVEEDDEDEDEDDDDDEDLED